MFDKIIQNFQNLTGEIKNLTTKQAIKLIGKIIKHGSYKQIAQLLALLEFVIPKSVKDKVDYIKLIREDFERQGPWAKLLKKLFTEINPNCREKLFSSFVINQTINGEVKRKEFAKQLGFQPPLFFVISPSMTCNLHCTGCYASEYSRKDKLPFDVYDRVIREGKEMGIYFYTISGGEPLFNKDNLKIFSKHSDCYFLVYTNGILIDKKMAKKIAELGNVAPGISVEGLEKETDTRRGKGTWKKIMQAMQNLRKEGVIFGFSTTQTQLNSKTITSEKFIDYFIKKGFVFGWFFQYIPIGRKPDIKLMATPEQRDELRKFVHGVCREKKPIFIGDFWNDGPYVDGCMAGGSLYFHINVHGDVEPCVFAHFAVDNVKNKSLKECLKSDFFRILRDRVQSTRAPHRHSDNLLTPCMIIDNPWVLRESVKKGKARPTHGGAETIIKHPKIIRHLNNYSQKMHKITDSIWEKEYCQSCSKCKDK